MNEHTFGFVEGDFLSIVGKGREVAKVVHISIEHYGSVIEVDDFCAIGSGAPEAMGSLFSTVNVDDPIKRIQDAIKSSATHDIYVDYPIVISSTENTEFKVFYEKDLAADQQCKSSK